MTEQFLEELEIDGMVKIYFTPDTIIPEESRFRFEQKIKEGFFRKKIIEYKAIIKLDGEVVECVNFTPTELHSMKAYISQNKAKFKKMIREMT